MAEIATSSEWLEARKSLLEKEKALSKLKDEVTLARQQMPWQKIEADYVFENETGEVSLASLFEGSSQLILVHFMYGPGWDAGCKSCSFWADQYDAMRNHLAGRDVSLAVVSRAPWQDFSAFKARMGWTFPWLSSIGNSFNFDFNVSFPGEERGVYNYSETTVMEEHPGISVFAKNENGEIFHTYSAYARGLDSLNATYQMLDIVPKGRDEDDLPFSMAWVNHHDAY